MKKRFAAALCVLTLVRATAVGAEPSFIGTTYSHRQSEYLGMDAKEAYLEILKLNFYVIRLGAYWDEIEKTEGQFDFTTLDWEIAEARKRNIPVVLTVGMKAPRWPEFFIPDWVLKRVHAGFGAEVSKDAYLRERTLAFIRETVKRYRRDKAVRYWQVENEALDRSGAKYWWIGRDFLRQEVALVRSLDPDGGRPIVLTAATYPNTILFFLARFRLDPNPIIESLKLCDILGINVYPVVGQRLWIFKLYFWSKPEERAEYFRRILHLVQRSGKKAWIMELQAEPWEPGMLVHTGKGRVPTGWPESVRESFREFRGLGFQTIFLWGSEYWYYRSTRQQDKNWWRTVVEIMTPGLAEYSFTAGKRTVNIVKNLRKLN